MRMKLANTSQEANMKTKDRITEAALSLFAENGFNGTSVKQIADAVGIRDASLYKHYKSKREAADPNRRGF